ncbi:hypothetical protein [Bacillus sp. RIT 809]|nr:hypothetical protein [Bacillus sp. RIT 809]
MKYLHKLFSKLGLVGHKDCLKYNCENYCGFSPSESILFWMKKD